MSRVVIDTHAVIWVMENSPQLSMVARAVIMDAYSRGFPVYVPSIVVVELTYLAERKRIPMNLFNQFQQNLKSADFGFQVVPLDINVANTLQQISRDIVPDMPDRIIAATAL